jgi:CO dehydrogenase/acetyl-CoA synthase epsilon subunit
VTNNSTQGIWKLSGANWVNISGAMKALAVIKANNYFGIGTDNNVYRYNGTTWLKVGVNVNSIAAGSDGTVLVTNNANQTIWQYVADNNWRQVTGNMKAVAVVKANNYFGIGTDNNVYRFNGTSWIEVGLNANSIAAGSDGTVLVTSSANQAIWQYVSDNNWQTVSGNMKSLAVVKTGNYYAVGVDNNVYFY